MRTSEQTATLITALLSARKAFSPIVKDAAGIVGKDRPYKYADLAAILEAIGPGLHANNLVILQSIDAETSSLVTRVTHTSGEWVESIYPLRNEPTNQAYGSALTYGRRYSIQCLLCLAASDDDGVASDTATAQKKKPSAPNISVPEQKRLFTIASQAGWSTDQIRAHLQTLGIQQSKDIPQTLYKQLCEDFDIPPLDDNRDV